MGASADHSIAVRRAAGDATVNLTDKLGFGALER
jgi:hypothetical protein